MSVRARAVIVVVIFLIILPVIIVQAQSAVEGEQPAGDGVVGQTGVATTAEEGTLADGARLAAEEGSVLGAEVAAVEEEEAVAESAIVEEAAVTSAASSEAGTQAEQTSEEAAVTEPAATTSPNEPTIVETAASSTPAGDPPAVPVEEPFVLQPAVKLDVNGSSITADISFQNLTCKSCGKILPALTVKAYYTAWYPNDGPEYTEAGARHAEQNVNVSDVGLWGSRSMTWSAADVAPGRYYFVVVVDPENVAGAYRLFRSEFRI